MRILQIIDSLIAAGAERMAVNISNALVNDGNKVWLCSSHSGGSLEAFIDKNVQYFTLNKRSFFDIIAFLKLCKIVRKNKIEVIHAHSTSLFWAVCVKVFSPGIKIIWHDHLGQRIEDDKFNHFIIFISFFIDGVIAVNDDLKVWSQQNLKVPSSKIVLINNFPMLNQIIIEKEKTNKIIRIICLANLRWQKDHITLIKAIDLLVNKLHITNLNVILAGTFSNDDYFHLILKEIEGHKLNNYFEIMGSISDTASLLCNADIGVLSSVYEGLSVSLLEYGLTGLPVVVTNVGQCAEVVDNGRVGMLVPPSDPDAMALALFTLIQSTELRFSLGSNFKNRVESEYGEGKFIIEYKKLLESINVR